MAMTVMHNNAAQMTLGELQKNSNSLSKKLQQVASGMKINGAGDGAAEYAISERMQVSLRALDQLDHAVDYALDEATTMGAYQARLGFTRSNLVTASENTQASESVIRDADMARAMTGLTKSNVLAQSAQAMLAQANQSSSSVLSLLQG